MATILTAKELDELERERAAGGISAREVVRLFERRGMRLSEATFRKYVQAGLLPRSRRVGQKGKHRGSRGVYPATVVRRVNAIKAMMAAGMTLQEIRGSFLFLRGELDTIEQSIAEVTRRMEAIVDERAPPSAAKRLRTEIEAVRGQAARLVQRMERLASRIVAARAGESTIQRDREET